jgi:hypothetical protein
MRQPWWFGSPEEVASSLRPRIPDEAQALLLSRAGDAARGRIMCFSRWTANSETRLTGYGWGGFRSAKLRRQDKGNGTCAASRLLLFRSCS